MILLIGAFIVALSSGVVAVIGQGSCSFMHVRGLDEQTACTLLEAITRTAEGPVRIVLTQTKGSESEEVSTRDADPRTGSFMTTFTGGGLVKLVIGKNSYTRMSPKRAEDKLVRHRLPRAEWVRRQVGDLFMNGSRPQRIDVSDDIVRQLRSARPDTRRTGSKFVVALRHSGYPATDVTFIVKAGRLAEQRLSSHQTVSTIRYSRFGIDPRLSAPAAGSVVDAEVYDRLLAEELETHRDVRCQQQLALLKAARPELEATCADGKITGPGLVIVPNG